MLNKQTVQRIGIQAEALEKRINMNKHLENYQRKMNGKTRKIGHSIHRNAEASRFFLSPANS